MAESRHQIEEVAALTGLSKRALRYYEEVELLAPEQRSEGGYRLYSDADVTRLRHIVSLRDALGYTLEEIKAVLAAEDELAEIRSTLQGDGEVHELISKCQRALTILQREEQRAARKLEQLTAVRQRYQERSQRARERIAELTSRLPGPAGPSLSSFSY